MTELPPDAESQRADAVGAVEDPPTPAEAGSDNDSESGDDGEPSGVAAADDAAARLRDLDGAPVDQHVGIYEDAHRRLEEGLADLDER
jgi:hypothetical protein